MLKTPELEKCKPRKYFETMALKNIEEKHYLKNNNDKYPIP